MRDLLPAVPLALAVLGACAARAPTAASHTEIIDGRLATSDEAVGIAAIVQRSNGHVVCTGTLVAPDVVLTAAHCLDDFAPDGADVYVVVSATRVDDPARPQLAIAGMRAHPEFPGPPSGDPTTLGAEHDVAVLLLATPSTEPPVPMLANDATLVPGASLTIAGYGVDDPVALTGLGELRTGDTLLVQRTDTELLAGEAATADTCYHDSGGPAFVTVGGARQLAGVTSRKSGTAAAPCGDGTIFTLVSPHRAFVDDSAAQLRRSRDGGCSVGGRGALPAWLVVLAVAVAAWSIRRTARRTCRRATARERT